MTNTEHFYAWEDPFYPFKGKKETTKSKQRELKQLGYAKTELTKVNPVLF